MSQRIKNNIAGLIVFIILAGLMSIVEAVTGLPQ